MYKPQLIAEIAGTANGDFTNPRKEKESMPFSYTISKKHQLVTIMACEPIDLPVCELCRAIIAEVKADPKFYPDYRLLADFRRMDFEPSSGEARSLAFLLAQNRGVFKNKVAVVVSGTLAYGLARMTSIYAELEGFGMMVFYDLEEATGWI